jgi:hypothetical protein
VSLHFIEEEIIHNNQARAKEQFNDRVILDHSYYTHKTNDQDVASFTVFGLAKNFNSFRRFSSCCHLAVCSKWRQLASVLLVGHTNSHIQFLHDVLYVQNVCINSKN